MALERDVTVEAAGRKFCFRFSCAAAEIMDPTGEKPFSEVVDGFRRLPSLLVAARAGLEGHRLHHSSRAQAFTDEDARAFVDAVGPLAAGNAVTTAYLAWEGIEITPEGDGGPKA